MKNCIILGCGRSGTSLLAGLLKESNYCLGKNLLPPTSSNPKGYFEDREVNNINEDILSINTINRPPFLGRYFFKTIPTKDQRWLSTVPLNKTIVSSVEINRKINHIISSASTPFCFKDPRFSYTLPVWKKYFPKNIKFLVVFRHPESTITSILKDCKSMQYLQNLKISEKRAYKVWYLMYSHILEKHMKTGNWLFLHYEQLLNYSSVERLELFLETKINTNLIDPNLYHSKPRNLIIPREIHKLYEKLNHLSNFEVC